jgi:hypothetical protein
VGAGAGVGPRLGRAELNQDPVLEEAFPVTFAGLPVLWKTERNQKIKANTVRRMLA